MKKAKSKPIKEKNKPYKAKCGPADVNYVDEAIRTIKETLANGANEETKVGIVSISNHPCSGCFLKDMVGEDIYKEFDEPLISIIRGEMEEMEDFQLCCEVIDGLYKWDEGCSDVFPQELRQLSDDVSADDPEKISEAVIYASMLLNDKFIGLQLAVLEMLKDIRGKRRYGENKLEDDTGPLASAIDKLELNPPYKFDEDICDDEMFDWVLGRDLASQLGEDLRKQVYKMCSSSLTSWVDIQAQIHDAEDELSALLKEARWKAEAVRGEVFSSLRKALQSQES